MSNRLKNETSPYLVQHSDNPVDWYPWCDEAFDKAKSQNKPIFLSIGYSTCHWCHVMAHESFENKQIAELLNRHFVSIKVDREERPDIDAVYMSVCQAFTGRGGWPMSIFMTWDKKPFFAGTYFPPHAQYGMHGFDTLLKTVAVLWEQSKGELLASADSIVNALKNTDRLFYAAGETDLPQKAAGLLADSFDSLCGGFGAAPKFPSPHNLLFLMLYAKQNGREDLLKMAEKTLVQMRLGGIFDHIGYGFSRYSTDRHYLVPHFEKMLYDNAWLIIAYLAAFSITGSSIYLDTAEKTAEYVLREMTSEEGGFFSAQDADSQGKEGKFYTFSLDEIIDVLGEEKGRAFAEIYDITPMGNFEGLNIPNLLKSRNIKANADEEKEKLYKYRKNRYHLHLDDKVLLSSNSMMIAAMSMLFRVTKNDRYLNSAKRACEFAKKYLMDEFALYTSSRDGKHSAQGFLDDYAYWIFALTELYNSTLDRQYLDRAEGVLAQAVKRFEDREKGGFYLSDAGSSELFINPKETYDGALPSGNSMMAYNLVRLHQLTEKEKYKTLFLKQQKFMANMCSGNPLVSTMFLLSELLYRTPPKQITVVLKDGEDIFSAAKNMPFLANARVQKADARYTLLKGKTTYYVCENRMCLPPRNEL